MFGRVTRSGSCGCSEQTAAEIGAGNFNTGHDCVAAATKNRTTIELRRPRTGDENPIGAIHQRG